MFKLLTLKALAIFLYCTPPQGYSREHRQTELKGMTGFNDGALTLISHQFMRNAGKKWMRLLWWEDISHPERILCSLFCSTLAAEQGGVWVRCWNK